MKNIRVAQAKNLPNTSFVVGDCENIPFPENTFDAIISSNSFHHYPNPQAFFNSAYKVLKKNGRLILRDYTTKSKILLWLCNHVEMPLAHLCGHGDVRLYSGAEFQKFAESAGFEVVSFEAQAKMRAHLVARKKEASYIVIHFKKIAVFLFVENGDFYLFIFCSVSIQQLKLLAQLLGSDLIL